MTTPVQNLAVTLSVDNGNYQVTMAAANQQSVVLQGSLTSLASQMNGPVTTAFTAAAQATTQFGNTFKAADLALAAFGASAGSVFGSALQAFRDFEQGVTNVVKVVEQLNSTSLAKFKDDITDLSQKIPVTATGMLLIAQNLGQLGFFAKSTADTINKDLVQSIDLVSKASVALGISQDQVGQSFGTLRNLFIDVGATTDVVTKRLRQFADVSNALSDETAATAEQIINFNTRLGATAKTLGFTFEQVSAMGAAVASLGQSVEVGATALQGFFGAFTTKAEVFASTLGVSVAQFKQLLAVSPNDTLLKFFTALNSKSAEVRNSIVRQITDSERAVTTINGLANNVGLLTAAQNTANRAIAEGTSVTNEFNRQALTLNNQLTLLGNQVQVALINGFSKIEPLLAGAITAFNDFGKAFPGLLTVIGAFIVAGAGLVTLIASYALLAPKFVALWRIVTVTVTEAAAALQINTLSLAANAAALRANAAAAAVSGTATAAAATSYTVATVAVGALNIALNTLRATLNLLILSGPLIAIAGLVEATLYASKLKNEIRDVKAELTKIQETGDLQAEFDFAAKAAKELRGNMSLLDGIMALVGVSARERVAQGLEEARDAAGDLLTQSAKNLSAFQQQQVAILNNVNASEQEKAIAEDKLKLNKQLIEAGVSLQELTDGIYSKSQETYLSLLKRSKLSDAEKLNLAYAFDVEQKRVGLLTAGTQSAYATLAAQIAQAAAIEASKVKLTEAAALVKEYTSEHASALSSTKAFITETAKSATSTAQFEGDRLKRLKDIAQAVIDENNAYDIKVSSIKQALNDSGVELTILEGIVSATGVAAIKQADKRAEAEKMVLALQKATTENGKFNVDAALSVQLVAAQRSEFLKYLEDRKLVVASVEAESAALTVAHKNKMADLDQELGQVTIYKQARVAAEDAVVTVVLANNAVRLKLLEQQKNAELATLAVGSNERIKVEDKFKDARTKIDAENLASTRKLEEARVQVATDAAKEIAGLAAKTNNTRLYLKDAANEQYGVELTVANAIEQQRAKVVELVQLRQRLSKDRQESKVLNAAIAGELQQAYVAQLRAVNELAKAERDRLKIVLDRVAQERSTQIDAVSTAKLEYAQAVSTADLKTTAGVAAERVAKLRLDSALQVAALESDGLLTSKEIEARRKVQLDTEQQSARLTGQLLTEQGKRDLKLAQDKINIEADAAQKKAALQGDPTAVLGIEQRRQAEVAKLDAKATASKKTLADKEYTDALARINEKYDKELGKATETTAGIGANTKRDQVEADKLANATLDVQRVAVAAAVGSYKELSDIANTRLESERLISAELEKQAAFAKSTTKLRDSLTTLEAPTLRVQQDAAKGDTATNRVTAAASRAVSDGATEQIDGKLVKDTANTLDKAANTAKSVKGGINYVLHGINKSSTALNDALTDLKTNVDALSKDSTAAKSATTVTR